MKQYANKRMTEDFLLSGQLGSLCVGVTVMIIMSSKLMEDVFLVVQKKAKLFVLILKEMLNVFVIQTYTLWKSKENVIRTLRRKDEYVCRKNDCQLPNEQLWSDGKCYEKRTEKCSRGLFFILERDKKTSKLVLQCEKDEIDLRSTFSTCLEKSDGTCQTKGVKFEPEIDWSFFRTFSKELYFEETGKGK
ncbi:uncharacterized protein LOC111698965 isoform X4 [Eurytemora carolleeae]|uniref:uncharacterized protein LOC111698965 isoform X4 n=1 Tax=Eurytemora carolleeae TaxID=1294199 RepID=UPI000C7730E1|nr:uncharacterized protein LOC111698965 isoform X4 [Eurytemora carolleeae]|eukprot:XP_023325239.1 uncharacterized protein LOC111698965 isoform X4 [Eurytemora affinis]